MTAPMDKVEAARRSLSAFRDTLLDTGPLGGMARWVETGAPPPAAQLRAAGFDGNPHADASADFDLRLTRSAFVRRWGFAIPCAEAVAALRRLGPLVEIGAGTAYWSALLRAAGHDVVATDAKPAGESIYNFQVGRWAPVEPLDAVAAVRRHSRRDVFCSWPTEGGAWPLGAAWALAPGRAFALIGGSLTGTRGLFRYLATRFDLEAEVQIPQFAGCDDRLSIHRKR
jgi:hypothetical protein